MGLKLFNPPHAKTTRDSEVISGRQAADYLKISHHVFFAAIKSGDIQPQMMIPRETTNEYGFDLNYIKEVAAVIPRVRGKGHTVFTSVVSEKLKQINNRWKKEGL